MEKEMSIEEKLKSVDGISFSKDSVIVTEDAIYKIELMPDLDTEEELKDDIAYIDGDYYYVYRGEPKGYSSLNRKPGIYKNKGDEHPRYFLVEPETDEEKEKYNALLQVSTLNPVSIIDTCNTKEELLIAIPESTKLFQPTISEQDDILKLVAKKAIIEKNIDLDRYKDRFTNKNELFNFKQVIRGDNKLSIRIFNRGMEALNLKYTIIIEERTDNDIVGQKLENPISVSSEETYTI